MTFVNYPYLLLLLLLPAYIAWYVVAHKKIEPTMRISSVEAFRGVAPSLRERMLHLPFVLRCLCFVFAIVALARPQVDTHRQPRSVEGIDIMLCMDVSTSMLAEDLKPNRTEASKQVAFDFIKDRPNDNIGLTIFAGDAFTQCPITTDHAALFNLLKATSSDIAAQGIISDGTAIGEGLANSVSRLKESKAKSKVVILLTDGTNNAGEISPKTAAEVAKSFNVRVYTIGVGTNGEAACPVVVNGRVEYMKMTVEIDMQTLKEIARTTGGKCFRATDNNKLAAVYDEIDRLEKSKLSVKDYSHNDDLFPLFVLLALISLLLEQTLRYTWLRRIPT